MIETSPRDLAILALHYQNDVLHQDGKIRVGFSSDSPRRTEVITAAQSMIAAARINRVPIVHVRVAFRPDRADLLANAPLLRHMEEIGAVEEGSWGADFHAALAPDTVSGREFVVRHVRINPFFGSELEVVLRRLGSRQLLIAGVSTHSVVESAVRHAVDMGFAVAVCADACASSSAAMHAASIESMRLLADIDDSTGALRRIEAAARP